LALTPGTRLGPYEVTAQIGVGGMGEVYRATDSNLKRSVAIKVLPAAVAKDSNRLARFQREAETLAALNHPHIAQIYGLEKSAGITALVMELVEGPTLAERITRGALTIEEALAIAKQIAEALEAAHEQGIVHRDLKPANIKVREDGTAKVLDFGLAKATEPAGAMSPNATQSPTITSPAMTRAGIILGTAAYMSPEQASGKTVDARSDIFSFGAVLYEMLSGRRAFNGDSTVAIMAAILRDEPQPLLSHPELVQIIKRCLSKSPADRFQVMTDVKASLAAVTPVDRAPAVAVLPFANMSDDKAQEYFSDGLAEEIINALVQIPGLKVTARTSAFAFRGKEQDITKIAEALHVSAILEGSVRKSGNRLRVTAQLINATDGYHLWSHRYDRELADVFVMQDEIAAAIASALRLELGGTPADRRAQQPNFRAYEALLKGRHLFFLNTHESLALAKEAFEQAIELDPEYSDAYAELAIWHFVHAAVGLSPASETILMARTNALKAVELAPAEPRAHAVLGAIAALYERDWEKGREQFQLALAARQVPPEVRFRYAVFYLLPLGRVREAVDSIERAVEQDPLNVVFRGAFAMVLSSESPDRAVAEARKAIEIDQRHWLPYYAMSMNHFRLGELPEARRLAERSATAAPWMPLPKGLLAGLQRRLGENESADALLSKLQSPSGKFIYHMVCSEIDAGADSFTKAIAQGEVQPLMWFGAGDFLRPLRSSPRWAALAKIMNLPTEAAGN
jgi:serine/threonine protein kinase/Tfp pilus assembly protein PilF